MVVTDMGALRHQRHHAWQRVDREQTHSGRFKLNLPTIAMGTIGAGAGTAIKVDPLTKKVSLGPKSAGASPDRWRSGWGVPNRRSATVTRSWVGSTDCFLGGKVKLDIEGAERVLQEKVADPLGIDIYEAEDMANLLAMDAKEAVRQMVSARAVDPPPLFQLCLDIPYGAPADPLHLQAMVNRLPEGAQWAAFALGRMQLPWLAQSMLLGGHVRVGPEDDLYLSKGVKATNEQLVARAVELIHNLGSRVATPDEARGILNLKPR